MRWTIILKAILIYLIQYKYKYWILKAYVSLVVSLFLFIFPVFANSTARKQGNSTETMLIKSFMAQWSWKHTTSTHTCHGPLWDIEDREKHHYLSVKTRKTEGRLCLIGGRVHRFSVDHNKVEWPGKRS